jgi:hypothetical protein
MFYFCFIISCFPRFDFLLNLIFQRFPRGYVLAMESFLAISDKLFNGRSDPRFVISMTGYFLLGKNSLNSFCQAVREREGQTVGSRCDDFYRRRGRCSSQLPKSIKPNVLQLT